MNEDFIMDQPRLKVFSPESVTYERSLHYTANITLKKALDEYAEEIKRISIRNVFCQLEEIQPDPTMGFSLEAWNRIKNKWCNDE